MGVGSEDAGEDFGSFVVARRQDLLGFAWWLTGDWHLAEDLVQSALAKCLPAWPRIREGSPDAYVRRAIVSAQHSWWRRRSNRETPVAETPERAGSDVTAAADLRHLVLAALDQLPRRQRATIVLRYYQDLSEAQAAEVLGCSVGTVKSQSAKALASLRASGVLLDQEEVNDAIR